MPAGSEPRTRSSVSPPTWARSTGARLPQPLLEPLALRFGLFSLGDVAEVEHHRAHARLMQQVLARELDPAPRAVLVRDLALVDRNLARLVQKLAAQLERLLAEFGMDEIHHLAAAQVLEREAEHALHRRAGVKDAAGRRAREDQRVGAVLDHRLVALPAAPERALAPSIAAEVSSVRSNTSQASSRHGANTAPSFAPLATSSGKPRTAEVASSTCSSVIGLGTQPAK